MQCPACNSLSAATDVRCLNCGTTLIYEAGGHSKEYEKASASLSARMRSGLGALAGFFLVAVALKVIFPANFLADRQILWASAIAGVAGSVVGRLLLKAK